MTAARLLVTIIGFAIIGTAMTRDAQARSSLACFDYAAHVCETEPDTCPESAAQRNEACRQWMIKNEDMPETCFGCASSCELDEDHCGTGLKGFGCQGSAQPCGA